MKKNLEVFERSARRAYEIARLKASLPIILLIAPLICVSALLCENEIVSCAIGLALIVTAVGFLWRGQLFGKGVFPGFVVGTFLFVGPTLLHSLGLCCIGNIETVVCVVSGALAGGFIAFRSAKSTQSRGSFVWSTAIVALLTGALGCATLGLGAALGLVVGFVAVALPTYLILAPSQK